MKDGIFYPLAILAGLAMIALAMVWPQGLGTVSPAPFGHAMAPAPPPEPDKGAIAKAAATALTPPAGKTSPDKTSLGKASPDKTSPGKAPPKLRPRIESDAPEAPKP